MVTCAKYATQVAAARAIVCGPNASRDLGHYLATYRGQRFTAAVAGAPPNVITAVVVAALPKLKVSVARARRPRLLVTTAAKITALLKQIPQTPGLSTVTSHQYTTILGRTSPAWQLWDLLATILKGAGHGGRWVTASKLMFAKRPQLLPIIDSRVKCHLHLGAVGKWEAIWCAMRDAEILAALQQLQQSVPEAATRTLLRVFDIVVWMQGACR